MNLFFSFWTPFPFLDLVITPPPEITPPAGEPSPAMTPVPIIVLVLLLIFIGYLIWNTLKNKK